MSEFSLIKQFCTDIGVRHEHTQLGVGDDAAVVAVPAGMEVAVSVDTMVEGVHFLPDVDPARLAHKLLAVNVSDMAAMGAQARWATLALTLPAIDEQWLAAFSVALDVAATHYGVELIGGDTTSGPLTLTLQIMGLVQKGAAIRRSGANVGDLVCVSGTLGDAALALHLGDTASSSLRNALEIPQAQAELGPALLNTASSAIDVSDGLAADLAHIARASNVTIVIDLESLPLSQAYQSADVGFDMALYGGDDYQLAFTVAAQEMIAVQKIAKQLGVVVTQIGRVERTGNAPIFLQHLGQLRSPDAQPGFDHFASNDSI